MRTLIRIPGTRNTRAITVGGTLRDKLGRWNPNLILIIGDLGFIAVVAGIMIRHPVEGGRVHFHRFD